MTGKSKDKHTAPPPKAKAKAGDDKGEANWTEGLKKLYDSVVDEPLPDQFRDLLSKLDFED